MPKPKLILLITILLILSASCLVFYANSLHNSFIWDDEALIVKNPVIHNWLNLPQVFSRDLYYESAFGSNFYRPIQTISYMWDYSFWQLDPYGYHLTNIILQILVSFLVFLFVKEIAGSLKLSLAASLFFALCPLHTESVTYISGRAEMLMGLFLLSAFILFARGLRVLSWFAFILGLLSKELAVVFPFIILAFLIYYKKEEGDRPRNLAKQVLPFFLIDVVYLFIRFAFLNFVTFRTPALAKTPLILRITVLPEVIFTYLKLLLFPQGLHMSWSISRPACFSAFFLSWFFLGMICVGCAYLLRRKGAASFMCFWSLAFFLPQSGVLPINSFIAEHFIYLPSISFFMFFAYLLNRYLRKELFVFCVICVTAYYGILTFSRNFDWQDTFVFYSKILKFSPNSFQAHNNLGLAYESRFDYSKAMMEYKMALEIEPQLIEARSNLANLYFKMGKYAEAKSEYAKLERVVPPSKAGEIQNNIACIYEVEGEFNEALKRYKIALQLDPKLNFAHFNIAKIYIIRGDKELAAEELLKSIPEIGLADNMRKKCLEAIRIYIKPLKEVKPAAIFYNDLGIELASHGLMDAAIAAFKRTLELSPFYDDAHFNLGLAFWKKGLVKQAVFEFKSVIKVNPNHLKAKEFLSEIIYKK